MVAFIGLAGALQLLGGFAFFYAARGGIHEVAGAVMIGSGTICLGLGILIEKLNRQTALLDRMLANQAK